MNKVTTPILLSLLSGSLGFGASQLTMASEVKVHTTQIQEIRHQAELDRQSFDKRMEIVVGLVQKVIEGQNIQSDQNRELIQLIKLQQQAGIK